MLSTSPAEEVSEPPAWLARLGAWAATHLGMVLLSWLAILAVFGAFAPQVESALSGAGWQDSTSSSVRARDIIARDFGGVGSTALQVVVHDSNGPIAADPTAQRAITQASDLLRADPRVSSVVPPQPGTTLSSDGQTAVIQAGAKGTGPDGSTAHCPTSDSRTDRPDQESESAPVR